MVYVLLAPGFEESEAIVPTDLLRQGGLETALVSLSGPTVTGGHNITVQADLELSQVDLDQAEMIVLPGGGVGVENLWNSDQVSRLIQEAAKRDIWLAALCAGPVLLARWGLLDGREATSYPTRHETSWARPRCCPRPGRWRTASLSPATPAVPPSTSV